MSIGLPPDTYDEVTWWNGDTGDSTTLSPGQSAPFTVEARIDGCIYAGEVRVTEVPEVLLQNEYTDIQTICAGETRTLNVSDLDSLQWAGEIYYPGEEILLDAVGDYILRGFRDGCAAEKTITVTQIPDPSPDYRQTISWCGTEPITLILPEDSPMWRFHWTDGAGSRERSVDSSGTYAFVIESDHCAFRSSYEVVEDLNCIAEECTLSIPNAVSPNGDGVNEDLRLFAPGCLAIRGARLLDKWGNVLYQTAAQTHATSLLIPADVWSPLSPGMYALAVDYEDANGRIKSTWRSVTVVR